MQLCKELFKIIRPLRFSWAYHTNRLLIYFDQQVHSSFSYSMSLDLDNKIIFMWEINWRLTSHRLQGTWNSIFRLTIGLSQSFSFSRYKFPKYSTVDLSSYSTCRHPRNGSDAVDARKMAKLKWRRDGGSGYWLRLETFAENIFYMFGLLLPL